jgi:hypothetical protein
MINFLRFHIILQLFFVSICLADETVIPKGIFTAIFWEKYESESFSYAPWGNEKEANATMVDISVGSSSLSRRFVYYGEGKLNFYNKRRPREWEEDQNKSNVKEPIKLTADFELPKSNEPSIEYLLLFVNKKKNGLWKIYPIPFSKTHVPFGQYNFISQSKEQLYLLFGKNEIIIPSGKSQVSPAVAENGERGVKLKAMIQKNGQYLEVFNQKWGHSENMRGIFFLRLNENKLNVKRVFEFKQPLSSASGYNTNPLTFIQDSQDKSHR